MFFYKKRVRKKRRKSKGGATFWLLTSLFMSAGMVSGVFFSNVSNEQLTFIQNPTADVFAYSFVKNIFVLTLLFLNAFSVIGFPITAMLLFACGHAISSSTIALFTSSQGTKLSFFLHALPHVAIHILMYFLLANSVFKYSKDLFTIVHFNQTKRELNKEFLKLFGAFLFSALLALLSAVYEAHIL